MPEQYKINYKAILQGWTNVAFKNEYFEKLAKERAKVCAGCEFFTTEYKFKKWTPPENNIEEIRGMGCERCGCPLSSKLRQVLQECPEKKW